MARHKNKPARRISPRALGAGQGLGRATLARPKGGGSQCTGGLSVLGEGGVIESIEHFDITIPFASTSATATITEVVPARSVIIDLGSTAREIKDYYNQTSLYLTNGTTVTGQRNSSGGASGDCYVRGIVIQWGDGAVNTIQRGTIVIPADAGDTLQEINTHITPVIIENAVVFVSHRGTQGDANGAPAQPLCFLSSSSNLRVQRRTQYKNYAGYTLNYEVCEFIGTGNYATSTTTTTTTTTTT